MNLIGNLLVAPPTLKGQLWHESVIMVTEHELNGSVGVILNKPSNLTINEFGEKIGVDLDIPGDVHIGGPLNPQSLSFLHTSDWKCDNTMIINDEFRLSSSPEIMPRLAAGDTPKQWRLFLGICGWQPKQLIREIKPVSGKLNTSWCVISSNSELVFEYNNVEQWEFAIEAAGQEFARKLLV